MKTIRLWVWTCCMLSIASTFAQVTQQVTALQYFYDTDPGVGTAGNGGIVAVTPTATLDQTFAIPLPGSLSKGIHYLYARVKDEYGRWSLAERRMFYITDIASGTRDLVAYQYFFDTDPGVGVSGTGAIVPVSSTADFSSTIGIALPTLSNGIHQLYIRAKNDQGIWSIAERRQFYITPIATGTRNIVAYQYFFDTDPGVGTSNVVPVTSTADFNTTIAIAIPSLANGIHYLYIRMKDDMGRWSIAERRNILVADVVEGTRNIVAYQYFFDNDPGAGVVGNGGIVPVASTDNLNTTVSIALPALSPGIHQMYLRTKDDAGRWSIAERRMFYISDVVPNTKDIVALEYYFDSDPGVRNGNPFPIAATSDFNSTIPLFVPCLTAGTHYLYVRAKDTANRWSIIARDTLTVTAGIEPAVVTPAGPVSICSGGSIVLSTTPVQGVTYQWVESGVPIPGQTNTSLTVTAAGSYAVRAICGSFVLSNTVVVSVLSINTYYADTDNDSYGNLASTTSACVQPSGYVTNSTDCDDTNASIHPNAPETCNLIDDDCDGTVDEGVQTTFYADADLDGYGDPISSTLACTMPAGYAANDDDCDDSNAGIKPGATETCNLMDDNCNGTVDEGVQSTFYADVDNDGYGNPFSSVLACTVPPGYVIDNTDCNDGSASAYPGATEICNLIDDDCDGLVDEGVQTVFYADADNDGFGNSGVTQMACTAPSGYVANDDDCDDNVSTTYPGASETCNLVDDDCDGLVDENVLNTFYADSDGDSYGDPNSSTTACLAPLGYVANDDDCNDSNAAVNPGATEVCNSIDDDCDGTVDEGILLTFYADTDSDGFGNASVTILACSAPAGYVSNYFDCNDASAAVYPGATETCNLIDDNCNGSIDEGVEITFYADADNDGYGNPAAFTEACTAPSGYVLDNTDCNDNSNVSYPGATEICNSLDDDCNGTVDDGFTFSMPATSVTSSETQTFCSGLTTTLILSGGQLGTDAEWIWYEGGCGTGSPIGSGMEVDITPSPGNHVYFVRAEGPCNATSCVSVSITVNSAPQLTNCPSLYSTTTSPGSCERAVPYSVVASASPSAAYTYEFSGVTAGSGNGTGSNSVFEKGLTQVMVTAENICGSQVCEFDIVINDQEDPVISNCIDTVFADFEEGQWGAHVDWAEPTATDNCELQSLTSDFAPGDFFVVGSTPVNYVATDADGNTSTCTTIVHIEQPGVLGEVNISIFANDLEYSEIHPDPGDTITLTATVHNTSSIGAGSFVVRLFDQFAQEYHDDITVDTLGPGESTTVSWTLETPPGIVFVPMQVFIDDDLELDESNELDNQAIRPYINGEFEFGGGIAVDPDTTIAVPAGSYVSLCGSAHYFGTAVPLEDSSVAGAQVKIFIIETNSYLYGTTNSHGEYCITFKSFRTPGLYHYEVEVTDFTITGDSTGTFELLAPLCPTELSIFMEINSSDFCKPYRYSAGGTVTGLLTVNNSCQAVSTPTTLYVTSTGGVPVPVLISIPALMPEEAYMVSLPPLTFANAGTASITAVIDYFDEVEEEIESNNSVTRVIFIYPAQPDLAPVSAASSRFDCTGPGINFYVDNKGGIATGSYSASCDVYRGATYLYTVEGTFPSIPPHCQHAISFDFDPVEVDEYTFVLNCDPEDELNELDELNNDFAKIASFISCGSNLVVDPECGEIDIKPADLAAGGPITIHTRIWNWGLTACNDPFEVGFDVDGTLYTATVNQPIAVGEAKDVSVVATAPVHGNRTITITADVNNDIAELNEGDNQKSEALCWDFSLTNEQCDGEKALEPGHSLCLLDTIQTRVYNNGLYEAGSLKVKFEISGPGYPPGWVTLGTITSFIDKTCECPLPVVLSQNFTYPQTGVYNFRITVDPLNQYTECNESDNQMLVTVNVSGLPDYAVYSQHIAPSELNPDLNEPVTFNLSYKNEGCTGNMSSELFLLADNDPVDSLIAMPLLTNTFTTYAISQPWSSSIPGLHVLRSFIDHDGIIVESNELNNEATRAILVGLIPDFHVADLQASNLSPLINSVITLTASIENEGGLASDAVIRWYSKHGDDPEQLIEQQSIHLAGLESVTRTFDWVVTDPNAKLIVRVEEANPLEFDFSDNERELVLNPISFMMMVTDVVCADLTLGTVSVNVTGGFQPYYIQWSNGYTGTSISVPSGIYSMTLTDALGSSRTAQDTVMDLALPATWYIDADGDGYGNPQVHQLACEQPAGHVGTGTDCNDNFANVYPEAPEIADGKDNDCDGLTDEGLNTLDVDAGDCKVTYYGYASSQCVNLTVNATGGITPYSYAWSTGSNTATINVCPGATMIYTVTVTDGNGFTAQDNVTVQVIDIRCGNNNNKVLVCHLPPGNPPNVQSICIAPSAVPEHLSHGDFLGVCEVTDPCEILPGSMQYVPDAIENIDEPDMDHEHSNAADEETPAQIVLFPNPADDQLHIQLPGDGEKFIVSMTDVSGLEWKSMTFGPGSAVIYTWDLPPGMYTVQILSMNNVMSKMIVIMH